MQGLQAIISTALGTIDAANTRSLKLANLEVLINAVLYNPSATLQIMESVQPGTSRVFFDKWFEAIRDDKRLPRVHDKKLTILALCALLEMDPVAVPEPIKEGWPQIISGILSIFKDLPHAIEGMFVCPVAQTSVTDADHLSARKELEASFQADSESDVEWEDGLLNLNDSEGMCVLPRERLGIDRISRGCLGRGFGIH